MILCNCHVHTNKLHCTNNSFIGISEAWKDSPDFALYLAELSASSLDKLSKFWVLHGFQELLRDCFAVLQAYFFFILLGNHSCGKL